MLVWSFPLTFKWKHAPQEQSNSELSTWFQRKHESVYKRDSHDHRVHLNKCSRFSSCSSSINCLDAGHSKITLHEIFILGHLNLPAKSAVLDDRW